MESQRSARIRHMAGLLAVHAIWPNPDDPGHAATRLILNCRDFPTSIAALAGAMTITTHITGATPDMDTVARQLETSTTDMWEATGTDIGVGFTRHTLTVATTGAAVDFLVNAVAAVPEPHRPTVLRAAVDTTLTAMRIIAQSGHPTP